VKRKRTGFTVVEVLAAVGIIALMVGLLIPALSMVRNTARETKQKVAITAGAGERLLWRTEARRSPCRLGPVRISSEIGFQV